MSEKVCSLLAGKTEGESKAICTHCPFPSCYLTSGKRYHLNPCSHCGGIMFFDEEDKEWRCYNCARSPVPQIKAETNPSTQPEIATVSRARSNYDAGKAKARVPRETQKQRFYYPISLSHLSTNGAWYPPNSLRYSRDQTIFLIKNLPMLSEGQYPPEPEEYKTEIYDKEAKENVEVIKKRSTYARTGKKGLNKRAYFETSAIITAELTTRMKHCGIDGMILLLFCSFDSENKEWLGRQIANFMGADLETVRKRAETALRYISGRWPKSRNYKQFVQHKGAESVSKKRGKQPEPTKSKFRRLFRL